MKRYGRDTWAGAAPWVAVFFVCAWAPGQSSTDAQPVLETPASEPAAPESCYWLRVTAERINVRSRPDTNSVIVARVERDAVLRADRQQFGWHRIIPPPGAFALVSATYVDRRSADDGVVSTRGGKLRVRVGSLVQPIDPQRSEVLARLERGTPVKIIGEQDGWLKIVPPPSVRLYVHGDFVERISPETAARLHSATTRPAPIQADSEQSAQPQDVDPQQRGPWGERLLMVETAIEAEAAKPPAEQSWAEALARLRPIAQQYAEPAVARLAAAWIGQLERRVAERDALRAADDVLKRAERQRQQHQREMRRIEQLRRQAAKSDFDARGELLRCAAAATPDGKRWYKLQDPLTRRLVAYLEPVPGTQIDFELHVGAYVGVRGPRRFEPTLGADLLRVRGLERLKQERPATRPATRPP